MPNKELLLNCLKSINKQKHDIKISRNPDYYAALRSDFNLKTITHISIISDGFTACISSNDGCTFTVFDIGDVFNSKSYSVEYAGLYQETSAIVKPLLDI